MKTIPAVNGISEGVDVRTGVCSDSDSVATAEADEVLGRIVIIGLAFSTFVGSLVEGPGLLESTGSILMPPKE